jgi:hypothetical protein
MAINLGSGAISAAYIGSTAVSAAYLGSSSVFTAGGGGGGITPNTDTRARFYLPASTTSFSVGANTSTGYYRLTDGTVTGTVAGGSYYSGNNYSYAYSSTATITGMTGTPIVELFSCDASGNASGSIQHIVLTANSGPVDAVDISGLGTITGMAAYSNVAYSGVYGHFGPGSGSSTLLSGITEIRAVNTTIAASSTAPFVTGGNTYYYGSGLDITDQDLDASALDQLYTDLGSTTGAQLIVRLNPGVSSDTPSIATAKTYTVYGS